jgi:exopolysaccharide biosynthesis polyprenyl glycosylphosphotransferase
MLKQHSSFVKQTIALVDCVLLACAFFFAHRWQSQHADIKPLLQYWMMFVGFLSFYLYFAWTRSLFSVMHFTWLNNLLWRLVVIFSSAGILGAAILYVVPDISNSRRLYLSFVLFGFCMIAAEKLLIKRLFMAARRRNRNTSPVLLFGRGRALARMRKEIEQHPEWGLRVVDTLDVSLSVRQFEKKLRQYHVEEVFFSIPRVLTTSGFCIDPYLQVCEEMGRAARVFLNMAEATRLARWHYQPFMDRASVLSHTVELDPDQLLFKRLFDIAGALVGVMILGLFYPLLALLIKLGSPGPVFFRQERVGKNGQRFRIYKFRTMGVDAEARKQQLAQHNELSGAVFKMKNDPRITPLGKILRKLSLDELPQFINVLRGEMSLVGTRPPTPDEVQEYKNWHHRRISIKPGITGMWQVSGRNSITDFDEIVKLDLRYIDTWSIGLDIRIIFKTISVVLLKSDSAY